MITKEQINSPAFVINNAMAINLLTLEAHLQYFILGQANLFHQMREGVLALLAIYTVSGTIFSASKTAL